MMTNVVARVSQLAAGQWGLLTTAQAASEGITRLQLARLADADVLERLGRGVYAATSAAGEHLGLRAAWLSLDPARTAEERLGKPNVAGVVSHASAAGLHGLGDLLNDEHEFTLPQRKQTRREGIRVHRGDLTEQDVTIVAGLPVTTEERTIADLLRAGNDPEHVAQIIGQGVRRGVIDLSDLAIRLDPLARRHNQPDGGALAEYLLDLVGLSRAALRLELAQSPAGQELVVVGQLTALSEMFAKMLPQFDTAQMVGKMLLQFDTAQMVGNMLPQFDTTQMIGKMLLQFDTAQMVGKMLPQFDTTQIAGLHQVGARMQRISPAIAQLQELSKVALSGSVQAAISAIGSTATKAGLASLTESSTQAAARATAAVQPTHRDGIDR